jgi:hypothetical protein
MGSASNPTWVKSSTTQAAQDNYVNARLHHINKHLKGDLVEKTLEALKADIAALKKAKREKVVEAYTHITERLRKADLTINFKAHKWFSTPNNYDSYTQMYERAIKGGQMVLTDSDPLNPAVVRAAADDKITFPTKWGMKQDDFEYKGSKSEWKAHPASNFQQPQQRGLSPGNVGQRLVGKMSPGPLKDSQASVNLLNQMGKPGAVPQPPAAAEFTASNPYFDPKTKQVFAAVNYARRPHGACTDYGHSYLVLTDKFKSNAIYFASDTFNVMVGKAVSANDQISYTLLGALYLKADAQMRQELLKSCLRDGSLADTASKDLLLEAHLFEPMKFTGGLLTVFLSAKDLVEEGDGAAKTKRAITPAEWQTIQENARIFARKHGAKLFFIE